MSSASVERASLPALAPEILQSLADIVFEGLVVVDGHGFILLLNPHAAEVLGIPAESARGRHFRDVFCPSLPPDQCWVDFALMRGKPVQRHRFQVELPGGIRRTALANFSPIVDASGAIAGAIITVDFENETYLLREEREKQKAILRSLAEGLFTVDTEKRITSFNRAAEQMTGWKEEDILGLPCRDVLRCSHCEDECPMTETLRRGKPIMDFDTEIIHRNGHKIPVCVNTTILYNSHGRAIGGVMSFRDYSKFHRLGDEALRQTAFHGIVGKNKRMLEVYSLIEDIADSKATVLILGESGTGKELVANAIQKLSPRRNKPFVKVNCAAIPDTLIESELFGHVKGAFTDAYSDRIGRFELAQGGTIFLDEVGDLTPPAQLRLLRVLEEGEFQRLGSSETIKVDVRVIAATNRNLWQMVQEGRFRDDLYYRLNVIPISLPPLRERKDDLPVLIEHFMEKFRRLTGKHIVDISDQAYDLLMAYDYPGNVRELENILEHAFARTRGNVITENKLPYFVRRPITGPSDFVVAGPPEQDDEAERIRQALMQCHWNRSRAARRLGMSRTTLWRKMKEYDLNHY